MLSWSSSKIGEGVETQLLTNRTGLECSHEAKALALSQLHFKWVHKLECDSRDVNNIFSNQLGILALPKTWITLVRLNGVILF